MTRAHPLTGLLFVAGLALAGSCGDDAGQSPLGFTEVGTAFDVGVGDEFTVVLESNATTGYAWALEVVPPRDVVRLVDDVYVAPATDLVGAPGRQELTFEAVGDGSTFLQLWYVRSFDDPAEPADRAQFEVTVGSGVPADATGDDGDQPAASIPDDEDPISVSALLATEPDSDVVVTGSLFDDGSGLVLCEVLAESFPPQCVGDAVAIANPDAITVDFTASGGVRWTDRPVVLFGQLRAGAFVVR